MDFRAYLARGLQRNYHHRTHTNGDSWLPWGPPNPDAPRLAVGFGQPCSLQVSDLVCQTLTNTGTTRGATECFFKVQNFT